MDKVIKTRDRYESTQKEKWDRDKQEQLRSV